MRLLGVLHPHKSDNPGFSTLTLAPGRQGSINPGFSFPLAWLRIYAHKRGNSLDFRFQDFGLALPGPWGLGLGASGFRTSGLHCQGLAVWVWGCEVLGLWICTATVFRFRVEAYLRPQTLNPKPCLTMSDLVLSGSSTESRCRGLALTTCIIISVLSSSSKKLDRTWLHCILQKL